MTANFFWDWLRIVGFLTIGLIVSIIIALFGISISHQRRKNDNKS